MPYTPGHTRAKAGPSLSLLTKITKLSLCAPQLADIHHYNAV